MCNNNNTDVPIWCPPGRSSFSGRISIHNEWPTLIYIYIYIYVTWTLIGQGRSLKIIGFHRWPEHSPHVLGPLCGALCRAPPRPLGRGPHRPPHMGRGMGRPARPGPGHGPGRPGLVWGAAPAWYGGPPISIPYWYSLLVRGVCLLVFPIGIHKVFPIGIPYWYSQKNVKKTKSSQ